jgi:hypothetical protein
MSQDEKTKGPPFYQSNTALSPDDEIFLWKKMWGVIRSFAKSLTGHGWKCDTGRRRKHEHQINTPIEQFKDRVMCLGVRLK